MLVFILACLLHIPAISGTASNSLSDCTTLASYFDTTCGGVAAASVTAMTGVNVTCTYGYTNSTCPGTYSSGSCVFLHKLCVTCSGSSPVRIRVQSNGLPRYCPFSPSRISETIIDFTVNFNPDVSISSPVHNPTTAAALNGIVCNVSQTSVPSASNFTLDSTSSRVSGLAGISVDGISIANANNVDYQDPFYPPDTNSSEGVDACLGHPDIQGTYHYHMASGCALTRPTRNISSCSNTASCRTNVSNYGISLFSSYRTLTVIGIAKDGHIIYGPYYSNGAEVTSGFDICNGVFHDSIGNYGYFATRTYPYITGCFGPGNYPTFFPNCTSNPPTIYTPLNFTSVSTTTTSSVTTTTTTNVTATTATTVTTTTTTTTTTTITTTTTANGTTAVTTLSNKARGHFEYTSECSLIFYMIILFFYLK